MISYQTPLLTLLFAIHREDYFRILGGKTATVEIPSKQWTLVIGYDRRAYKFTVNVDGVEMSDLPKAPKTAECYPSFCKSSDKKKYSETIK